MRQTRRLVILAVFCLGSALGASATTYYVSPNGSDSNAGTSDKAAWKTLAKVNARDFSAGDIIGFERGGTWTGNLTIRNSGQQGNPITVTAYGASIAKPIIRNPGSWTYSITVRADWIVIENLLLRDSHYSGISLASGSDRNIVRDCEFTGMGSAVIFDGQYNLATKNSVHDMVMVVNTPGGTDDFGANGFLVKSPNNEISYNKIWNCRVPSYDYEYDGGAVELYGNVDNSHIHHNWASNCQSFAEVGGEPGSAHGVRIRHNLCVNNAGGFMAVHNSGAYSSDVYDLRVEHNTMVENAGASGWVLVWFSSSPSAASVIFRNNIVMIDKVRYLANVDFSHSHNLYRLLNGGTQLTASGGGLKTGEAFGDPRFVSVSQNNYHLQSGSPAINKGIDLGYRLDFDDLPMPDGGAPDLGAFEYRSGRPEPPENVRVSF